MTAPEYVALREALVGRGYGAEIEWSRSVRPPGSAEDLAGEAIWVVCCSGFSAARARGLYEIVRRALLANRSATTVFPRSAKGRAIDAIWSQRAAHFDRMRALTGAAAPVDQVLAWIATLPYVGGPVLRYHMAKNIGVDCAKPDVHLTRLADARGTTPQRLCEYLARETGDRVATVDTVLWRACSLRLIGDCGTPVG